MNTRPIPPVGENSASRLAGLDTVRFGAALLVALSHGMLIPPRIYLDAGSPFAFWTGAIGHALANGPAAVALFFVISGLCIHLGRQSVASNPLQFILRRMVRIGVPVVAILLLARAVGTYAVELEQAVLWSVYCEIFYYLIYPLFLLARRRWPLRLMFLASAALSLLLLAILPPQARMWEYGFATALICYPLWILGAMIAEGAGAIEGRRSELIWAWRLGLVLIGACCAAARGTAWADQMPFLTYAVIGLASVPYLRTEIAHAKAGSVSRGAEALGKASYSLYLVHIVPLTLIDQATAHLPQLMAGTAELAVVGTATVAFYLLCEKPAQRLAASIRAPAGRWRKPRAEVRVAR